MLTPNLILLYVEDPEQSAAFYTRLLGRGPVAAFPAYVAYALDNGLNFSLWSTKAANFVSSGSGHRMEIAFMVKDDAEVERLYAEWRKAGIPIEQDLMTAVFGRTFVALDPDGHRLRVCTPDK
ncbi:MULTISPECIES: VOC family protein [Ensifer]|jgi:catechol 2,3-dioxygenase-like lactoylglutathione lyase family enzyme|uniref:Glyoxalase n=1 Tax=Ensifer canadensis TaxID=555315 RepID=A0AAW4FP46_9HYPH|nr:MULTISPECIES: VOC family protein [Ensifer]AHK42578.1 putative glyoxalase/bleomycin resistance protein/dioxygenase [Ensifer adhaerens OV14]KQU77286.1 glyoxalase [Ensifer sp. Root31]KQW34333.1 glyoxalase [Ensifer sp. Root1252]KQW56123.1 glyoxalase [Ensifer sp. Root127]KQY61489.1 glyoxalase [Ensifer sp. Root142]